MVRENHQSRDAGNGAADGFVYKLIFWCVLFISMLLRVPHMFVGRLWPDEALYAWNAKRIFAHPELIFSKEIVDFHPPLFSMILSPAHGLFPPFMACHITVFLLNMLGIVMIYCLGCKIQGRFLGCFAAMALAFNFYYFGMSGYILIDGVLTVFLILFFYGFEKTHSPRIARQEFYLGFMTMAVILLKWSGGLVLPFLALYYFLFYKDLTIGDRIRKTAIPLAMGCLLVAALLWSNHLIQGSWVPKVFGFSHERYEKPFFYYFQEWNNVISIQMVPFFILGLYLSLSGRNHLHSVHGIWVVFTLLAISLMTNKDSRFLLMIIPGVVLLTGLGFEKAVSFLEKFTQWKWCKPVSLLVVLAFLFFFQYAQFSRFLVANGHSYTGFQEAGEAVTGMVARFPDARVLASSPRAIRYFTDSNFKEFGGAISPMPKSEAELKDILDGTEQDFILVLDAWEWAQPRWLYPVSNEKLKVLRDMGFQQEYVVRKFATLRDYSIREKNVIWIFIRPKAAGR